MQFGVQQQQASAGAGRRCASFAGFVRAGAYTLVDPDPVTPNLCFRTSHRKAYRLGKFLQDVNGLRKVRLASGHLAVLELVVYLGEGTYYFLDQFTW
jgi:hypothetical protein